MRIGLGLGPSRAVRKRSRQRPLQIVGSRGEILTLQGGATTSGNVKQNGRHRFYIGNADVSELRVAYAGWWVDATTAEQSLANGYRIAATVEIGGVVKRFKFSGVNDGQVTAGQTMLMSDPLLPSEFGLNVFAAGTLLWIKSEREVTLGQRLGYHQTPSYSVPTTGETYYVGATSAVSQLDNAGALVSTGGWSVQAHVWTPLAIFGRPVTRMMATAVYGDSVANGDGGGSGDGLGATGGGFLRRGLADVNGVKTARVNLARSSETAARLNLYNAHRFALLPYVNHVKLVSGGNDYTDGETVANTIIRLASIRAQIKAINPAAHLEQYELWVKTNSTDSWATVANQTPRSNMETGGTFRDPVNADIAAAVGTNLDAFIIFAPGVMTDTTFIDRWKAGATGDGTHPNATTYQAMADANDANLEALRTAYEDT